MVKDEEKVLLTKLPCPVPSCDYITEEAEMTCSMKLLEMHERVAHAVPVPSPQLVVKEGFVTEEAFGYFEHAWKE